MMRNALTTLVAPFLIFAVDMIVVGSAYTPPSPPRKCTRKTFVSTCASTLTSAAVLLQTTAVATYPQAADAFDGSGSSAYSGRTPSSKAELKQSYRTRITADVKDFNVLGAVIDGGETEGDAWVNFFVEFQRREADDVGRTYAALADLVGTKDVSGCGLLLATSYAKAGKPADNVPSMKKYNTMLKAFEPIKSAGKKGDAGKAKAAWTKAGGALSEYLGEVDLPSSLSDPIYN